MVKQWKKSLEQTDIVSDGEAFRGANIDAPISSAGVDWASKTPKTSSGKAPSGGGVAISVTGSGYITGVRAEYIDGSVVADFRIDGTTLFSDTLDNTMFAARNSDSYLMSTVYRFNSSFEIEYGDGGGFYRAGVAYALD